MSTKDHLFPRKNGKVMPKLILKAELPIISLVQGQNFEPRPRPVIGKKAFLHNKWITTGNL